MKKIKVGLRIMKNYTTLSNSIPKAEITIKDVERAVKMLEAIKPLEYSNDPRVVMLCKKHYRLIMAEIKEVSVVSPYYTILGGLDVHFYIKPYLKKIRILSIPSSKLFLGKSSVSQNEDCKTLEL